MMIALLIGCPKSQPAPLYASQVPALLEGLQDLPAAPGGDCPYAAAVHPGEPPPFTVDGLATCGGLLLPEATVWAYEHDARVSRYTADWASACRIGRLDDRARAEAAVLALREERAVLMREATSARWAVPAAALVGAVLGGALAVGLSQGMQL